jgi:hypothetical protein
MIKKKCVCAHLDQLYELVEESEGYPTLLLSKVGTDALFFYRRKTAIYGAFLHIFISFVKNRRRHVPKITGECTPDTVGDWGRRVQEAIELRCDNSQKISFSGAFSEGALCVLTIWRAPQSLRGDARQCTRLANNQHVQSVSLSLKAVMFNAYRALWDKSHKKKGEMHPGLRNKIVSSAPA